MTTAVVFAYSEVGYRCLQVLLRHAVTIPLVFSHQDVLIVLMREDQRDRDCMPQ